jgi:hypothetical protein
MLQPKKSTAKKPNPVKKYKKTSAGDSLGEDLFEIIDPTGISSYDDVYRSYKENGLLSWQTGLEVLGALPIIGKAGKGIKLATTSSKYLKALSKTNKITAKAEKVIPEVLTLAKNFGETAQKVSRGGRANPIAAGSIAVGIGAKGLQKVTKVIEKGGKKVVKEVIKKSPANKRVINETVATVNSANTLSDVAGAVQGQVVQPITETVKDYAKEKEKEQYQPIPKKIVYYNTDPKRGEVEKPGKEEGIQYVPVSNSAQLEKWKNQKLAYGTNSQGIMKTKMNPRKKYANGSDAKGMNTNNYIISPAEALADYDIMMAKAENAAVNNPWAPYVSAIGGAASTFLSNSAGLLTADGAGIKGNAAGLLKKAIPTGGNIMASNAVGTSAAMGMNNVQTDVEVEGGEMYETPQGQVGEFQGPSHEQGGIPLEVGQDVEEGTKVYSDRLKVGDKTLAERKATRERRIANLEKIASKPLVDQAVKNASKRKMMAIEKEEMADLDFQDKVNNMQAMADTMVEAFACGTGMKGIQKYPWGTPPTGIKYGKGYDESMFKDFFAKYNELNPGGVMDMNYIQGDLGMDPKTRGFGKVFGPGTYKASQDWLAANKDKKPDPYVLGDVNEDGIQDTLGNNPNINLEALQNFKIGEGVNDNASLSYGDPYAKDGVNFEMPTETIMTPVTAYEQGVDTGETPETKKEPSKLKQALLNSIPSLGDALKLFGNYKGMTAGIDTATEQRASDIPFQNVFRNAGEESQKMLDNAKQGVETSKTQAIVKANANTRTGRKGARNSARGVNQMRGMDWLYDTALNTTISDIMAKAAEQMSNIDVQKSGVALNADQLKGQGEWQRALADQAAKDAYYTALALGRKDFATGMQQSGKDLNDMKTNKILEKLLSQSGEYAGMTAGGDFFGKPATASKTSKGTTKEDVKVQIDAQGNKFIMLDGKKITVTV